MKFVSTKELKPGMRIARPIFNRNGVLLFEADSRLTDTGINSIKNFGLLGLYILDPAEPAQPMTEEDLEFEKIQTMESYAIQEELERILNTGKCWRMEMIIGRLTKNYGHLDRKISFYQNLRNREDYIYKHSLNVAILCAMMSNVLNLKLEDRHQLLIAAIVHDIGKVGIMRELYDFDESNPQTRKKLRSAEVAGYPLIESVFGETSPIRRICMQSQKVLADFADGISPSGKLVPGARILAVADFFDSVTAMQIGREPDSEVKAVKLLTAWPQYFDRKTVDALLKSIHILPRGTGVVFNTGEKALVIAENEKDVLRPMVLSFSDNSTIDLSNTVLYDDIEIVDILKTLDNRHVLNIQPEDGQENKENE